MGFSRITLSTRYTRTRCFRSLRSVLLVYSPDLHCISRSGAEVCFLLFYWLLPPLLCWFHFLFPISYLRSDSSILSAVPLFASKDHRDPLDYDLKSLLNRRHAIFGSMFFLRGMGIATGKYLFPLYVFYVVGVAINAGSVQYYGQSWICGIRIVYVR